MKWLFTLLVPAMIISAAQGQNGSCYYSLVLEGALGDGWGGSTLEVVNGTDTSVLTLEEDSFRFVLLPVVNGDPVAITFSAAPGSDVQGIAVRLRNANDELLAELLEPADGESFSTAALCPACPNVPGGSVAVEDVRDTFARVSWPPLDSADFFLVEVGQSGFTPGNGVLLDAPGNAFTIPDLVENRTFDFYLRTVCLSGDTTQALGPFTFTTLFSHNVGVVSVLRPPVNCNNDAMSKLRIGIRNFGGRPQSLIPVRFSLNGVPGSVSMPTDGVFTGVIGKDSTEIFEFDVEVNTMELGENVLKVWTDLEEEDVRANDTITYLFYTRFELPLREDFEAFTGGGWELSEEVRIAEEHNAGSQVLFSRLNADTAAFEALSPQFGFIVPGDSLVFDYRLVQAPAGDAPAVLGIGDSLLVEISTDCGETFEPVFSAVENSHSPSTEFTRQGIDLSPYLGERIRLRFRGRWASGDFFADVDNINFLRCINNFQPLVDVTPASGQGVNDGAIALAPQVGLPEYTYSWSTGDTTASIDSLFAGTYTATITDATGCSQTLEVFVDLATSTFSPAAEPLALSLAPNPSSGHAQLRLRLERPAEVQVRIFNAMGQSVQPPLELFTDRLDENLFVGQLPPGLYIVQVRAGERRESLRLLKR